MATTSDTKEPELVGLRRRAEQLAEKRKERVTSAHLLAAMAVHPGIAATLLHDRRLGPEELLRAARSASDDERDPLRLALNAGRAVAQRMRAPEASALHLLIALLGDRRTAAYRALDQAGIDVGRLRLAAMNQALGLLGRQPVAPQVRASKSALGELRARETPASPGERSRAPRSISRVRRAQIVTPEDLRKRRRRAAEPVELTPSSGAPAAAPSPSPAQTAAIETRFALPEKQFPLLSRLGKNLTLAAARGEIDPVVCRDSEVEQILAVLCQRFGNAPCLVGPSGVGKTRIVHALAARLAADPPPRGVAARIIVELGAGALVAGTGVRGGLAERMSAIAAEIEQSQGRVLVFFDELHQLFSGDGGEELCSELKLLLGQGRLPCVGATTPAQYARCIESDAALSRRFSVVEIEEPSREDAFLMLSALEPKFEAHHGVSYDEDALALAVRWSLEYVPGKALPDKAVAVIDAAGARARRRALASVGRGEVAEIVSELSGVPVERLLESDAERLLNLEKTLAARVVGHAPALAAIAKAVRRNAAGLGGRRPIGTFLLLGPTGVGKTETAKALAEALFFSEQAMTRIDLSEYSEAHSVARLLGAPPGYVGHDQGGQLTEAVRRRPYQVLLLDELEKAHEEVLASFLGVFDEARLTDGRGRTVDFSHTLIVMTSNLGASAVAAGRQLGFSRSEPAARADYSARITQKARETLAPELWNRIDEVLVFAPLDRPTVCEIARRSLERLGQRLLEARGVSVSFDDAAIDCLLASGGMDLALGARPMQRTIRKHVEAPLSDLILRGELGEGEQLMVSASRGSITITRATKLVRAV